MRYAVALSYIFQPATQSKRETKENTEEKTSLLPPFNAAYFIFQYGNKNWKFNGGSTLQDLNNAPIVSFFVHVYKNDQHIVLLFILVV